MGIHKIISTGSVDSLRLFKHLWLCFFGDIDVVKLSPHFGLNIIHVTVIMTHFSTAFMYQNRIQNVRLCSYGLITLFNILFNTINSLLVIVWLFLYFLMVRFNHMDKLWGNFILQLWKYQWLLLSVRVLFKLHLVCLRFEKFHCHLQIL